MFEQHFKAYLDEIEPYLDQAFPVQENAWGGEVVQAARYSLLSGGKRVRPVLLLAMMDCLGAGHLQALPYAAALEMIHTYSLIHDDLPCMDDDDLRRGRPTCHKQFGEALAVLAGDALLNRAFEIMLDDMTSGCQHKAEAARIIARAAGSSGMIAGQTLDLQAEGRIVSPDELMRLHSLKTGQLILAPVLAACALVGVSAEVTALFKTFATNLGLAFQIQDDILDVTATEDKLGKSTGKDQRDQKSTYVTLFGLETAHIKLLEATRQAKEALLAAAGTGFDPSFLQELAEFLLQRDH
ncbi:MAG: polyprenyl synthetase family protein [Clostridia bacterium]|nr:polyprenyl synthetase family protein [Clostridia bacterium]